MAWNLLVTEGWDGQLGQSVMLRDTMGCHLMFHGVPWGLRDGMTAATEGFVERHNGTSLDVPFIP